MEELAIFLDEFKQLPSAQDMANYLFEMRPTKTEAARFANIALTPMVYIGTGKRKNIHIKYYRNLVTAYITTRLNQSKPSSESV